MNIKNLVITLALTLIAGVAYAADTTAPEPVKPIVLQQYPEEDSYVKPLDPIYINFNPQKGEVVFNSAKIWINAINPTPSTNRSAGTLPGSRGANQLVIYTPAYGTRTHTNEFGGEAIVEGTTVTELSGADSFIPSGGAVISGHGNAKTWINNNIHIGTKVFIDRTNNILYAYTTSESYLFETEKKITEAEEMVEYYKSTTVNYNWRVTETYINEARENLKKAQKNPEMVQQYSKMAIDAANDALKSVIPYKDCELKGIWVRPTEKTETDIINSINTIQKAGINNIFLETYYHGRTIYPSKTMVGYGLIPQYEQFQGFDPLKIWINEAHKRNMKVHTWFETFYTGNFNPKDYPTSILGAYPQWSNKTRSDASSETPTRCPAEHNGYFLDPANPEVQDFLLKLINEIICEYKPDGINIDYIRYPNAVSTIDANSWGYSPYARKEFKNIYGADPVELNPYDPLTTQWSNYRREKVGEFVKKAGEAAAKANVYSTTVIFPDRQAALTNKLQDWRTWSLKGYVNGFTPLFLTCDSKMASQMMQEVLKQKGPNTDFYAGLFVTFMGGSEVDLIRQIHEARKLNANGVIMFDYAHLENKYSKALATSVFSSTPLPPPPTTSTKPEVKKKKWWQFFGN